MSNSNNFQNTPSSSADFLAISQWLSRAFLCLQGTPEFIHKVDYVDAFEELQEAHSRLQWIIKVQQKSAKSPPTLSDDYLDYLDLSRWLSRAFLCLQGTPEFINKENDIDSLAEMKKAHEQIQRMIRERQKPGE